MIINHNMPAMNGHRQLKMNTSDNQKSIEKLSSGFRINRAGDDAAGLAISEKMRAQVRGLNQASRNAQDGISLIQTAEGALTENHAILQRMRELTVQAANDTNVSVDRENIGREVKELQKEIQRIAANTEFNTKKLLDGSSDDIELQIGANNGQMLNISIRSMGVDALSVDSNDFVIKSTTTSASFSTFLKNLDAAINTVSEERAYLGANQNRLEHTIKNLDVASENLQAAESRIRDVDMAKEMMEFTKTNILSQAAQSMLAQANQAPQGVLSLLR